MQRGLSEKAMASISEPIEHAGGRLLPEYLETRVFWRLRLRMSASSIYRMFSRARLRLSLVASLSVFFWVGLYILFLKGFAFLANMSADVVQPLYNAFFLSLMVMLTFSSGIILYSSLFCSPETAFLLTTPVRPERIYSHKFQEAVWFSSWGFILLGSPTLVAYGVAAEAPWYYFVLLLPFIIAFVHIPAAVGGIVCLLVVNRWASLRLHILGILSAIVVTFVVWLVWSMLSGTESDLGKATWFKEMESRLRYTEQRILPSWWLTTGLLEASHPAPATAYGDPPWAQSLLFLALLVSNALALNLLGSWLAHRLYRSSYSRLYGEQTARRHASTWWIDDVLLQLPIFLPREIRLLLVKDFRLFRRDPTQWSQILIFFGLLAPYFFYIRKFTANPGYSSMIGFLNLAVIGLILSTFTTRFIYPMISLEGRQLWILGLLPIRRESIIWSKFLFAAVGSLIPCTILILLSDMMLEISAQLLVVHQLSCLVLCLGLSAIAVGLGAYMPDLHERSPSKIAAGFGGTLNLVVSAAYIVVIVLATALPVHLYLATQQEQAQGTLYPVLQFLASKTGIFSGISLTIVVGIIATVWPLRLGLRAFRNLEV